MADKLVQLNIPLEDAREISDAFSKLVTEMEQSPFSSEKGSNTITFQMKWTAASKRAINNLLTQLRTI